MRNTNVPRAFGITSPFSYQKLCKCLADNWENIRLHFTKQTEGNPYKISRLHIRKLKNKSCLFEMNYKNWRIDGFPEPELLIGKRYLVKADIANCFPSIYTHSIPWALVGKDVAKQDKSNKKWFNQIDHFTQNCKNGETHGLLIGPHTSNFLAEIILTVIDKQLFDSNWEHIRCIDDYSCYVSNYEQGQQFLIELAACLRNFDLSLNHKKTEIIELPVVAHEQWIHQLNSISFNQKNILIDFNLMRSYLDSAIELMRNNQMNSAVLNYAIKVLGTVKLSKNATDYCVKTILHLAFIFQYLIPLLDTYLFIPFQVGREKIIDFTNKIYSEALRLKNYEATSYAVYFALKYNFSLTVMPIDDIIKSRDCIFILISYLLFKKERNKASCSKIKEYAKTLLEPIDFGTNWLLLFEVFPASSFKAHWKSLKEAGISFIKNI
jgi:hypothetical protein